MYDFAIVALLALATVKLVDFVCDQVEVVARLRSLLTFVVAIAAVLALDYSLFAGFGVAVENATVGTWMTGFIVAGLTVPWRALFGFLTHNRASGDETLGERSPIARAA